MSQLANRPFLKMNGIGNEIIVLDLRGIDHVVSAAEARAIGRGESAGRTLAFDQLMVIHDAAGDAPPGADARMKIYNIDGSLSGACGNGTRCVAWALTRGTARKTLVLDSDAGRLECTREGEWRFTVDMGAPKFGWQEIPLARDPGDTAAIPSPAPQAMPGVFSAVNMGNPHAVFFVDDPDAIDLAKAGPVIEHDPLFPERVNLSVATVRSRDHIDLKVWERGAGATLACGSAACATLVAAVRRGLTEASARVSLPGGDLVITWRERDSRVLMTGDVELEFEGTFEPGLFEGIAA